MTVCVTSGDVRGLCYASWSFSPLVGFGKSVSNMALIEHLFRL